MRFIFAFLGVLLFAQVACAQKFGYVDTEFITSKMPEYAKAQQQIDQNTKTWLAEVEKKKEELEKLARDNAEIKSAISGLDVKKVIAVAPKLVNFVI